MKTLETERLILTGWNLSDEDIDGLYAYAKNPDVLAVRNLKRL